MSRVLSTGNRTDPSVPMAAVPTPTGAPVPPPRPVGPTAGAPQGSLGDDDRPHHLLGVDLAVVAELAGVVEGVTVRTGGHAAGVGGPVVGRHRVGDATGVPRPHHLLACLDGQPGRVEGGGMQDDGRRRRPVLTVALISVLISIAPAVAVVVATAIAIVRAVRRR